MSLPRLAGGGEGGSVPTFPGGLGGTRRGNDDSPSRAASIRSGAGSARSAASAISMHVNSYSYLISRAYDFLQARSSWQRRTEQNELKGGGDEGEDALKVRMSDRPIDPWSCFVPMVLSSTSNYISIESTPGTKDETAV